MKDKQNVFGYWKKAGVMAEIDGEPWFLGSMVAAMLGYELGTDIPALFKNVPDGWKGLKLVSNPFGTPEAFCISEQGLYDFVLSSGRPGARPFQKMVFEEVLPLINKFGAYMTGGLIDEALENSVNVVEDFKEYKESMQGKASEA